ncbi:hypothetical protein LINPERPRIM_LOCUS7228, partial [Linum perenne]
MRVLLGVLAFELDDPPPPALHPRLLCPFSILQVINYGPLPCKSNDNTPIKGCHWPLQFP